MMEEKSIDQKLIEILHSNKKLDEKSDEMRLVTQPASIRKLWQMTEDGELNTEVKRKILTFLADYNRKNELIIKNEINISDLEGLDEEELRKKRNEIYKKWMMEGKKN